MTPSRALRSWSQLTVQVALLLVALGALQVVSDRLNRRVDLTPTRAFSLSAVSRKVLAEVTQPLSITVFFPRGRRAPFAETLQRLRAAQPLLQVELLDFERFPDRAKALGVTHTGRAALAYGDNRAVVSALPEDVLVGGVLRVLRGARRRVGFTTGHGERPLGGGSEAYGRFVAALDAENYASGPLSLLDGSVPDDVALVVVAGPTRDFLPPEIERLAVHLRRGGGVLLLLDPGPLPAVRFLLATMGIALGDDFVVERERRILGTDGLAAVVERFKPGNPVTFPAGHPIDMGVVLPSARTVRVVEERPGVTADVIAITDDSAWAMADPERARRGEEPSKAHHDVAGAAPVLVIADVGPGEDDGVRRRGRLVVAGDADFASDAYLDLLGNRDLALNAVAWTAGEEVLAGERPKDVAEIFRPFSPLVITDRQGRWILLATTVIQPSLVLLVGIGVVLRRRRAG